MEAIIANFRRNRHSQKGNHMIIEIEGIDRKDKAESLVGKEVVWKSPADREIKGKVAAAHGNKGAIRVIFEKGMPGQSVGTKVQIK
ncbi:50S ribosomal protein L35ae [Candidatus Woesearchaeota archaeon]|nr:50S ribosomal protein L35ae [Candidatus Woesearchaeota archaeon]